MSEFNRDLKFQVVRKGILKLKLDYKHGSKHDTAICPKTGAKTMIPRTKRLNKYTVGGICDFLVVNGYSKEQIRKAFKIK